MSPPRTSHGVRVTVAAGCGLLAGLFAAASPARADYQVTGRFQYTDRFYTLGGFTGSQPDVPIREADVEVVDATTQLVLATGVTDQNGFFTIQVTDNLTRNLTVRALTSSNYTPDLHMRVLDTFSNGVYAVAHPTIFNHGPNDDIDFTGSPVVAPADADAHGVGNAFNIFDVALDALDFVAAMDGSRPDITNLLTLKWASGSVQGTWYSDSNATIMLLGHATDSDGYDDSVIQHEVGHYVEFRLADSDNPGGEHFLDQCYAMTLTWSEGWSTFFQNMVRNWKGLNRPDIYVDTDGQPGTGGAFISYSVETIPFPLDAGSGNEASVNAALWDIVDRPATLDASIGSDDDLLNFTDGSERTWDVHQNYIPGVSNISIEKFWDGWFNNGHGSFNDMSAVFETYKMEFYDDSYEPNDSAGQARNAGLDQTTTQHTLYPVGDTDWTRFDGVQGGNYRFETTNVPCGAATFLTLFDSDASTVLATHSSVINWTATKNGNLYVRVTRPAPHQYGNYDLKVTIDSVPVVISDVRLIATEDGVQLDWRGVEEGGFSHFDVERGAAAEGPFVRLNRDPVVADSPGHYVFLDATAQAGRTYWYRLVSVESSGERQAFGPYRTTLGVPARLVLHPASPNPFNPGTRLRFELPKAGPVFLRVYDVSGRVVRHLLRGEHNLAGTRVLVWDGRDDRQRNVPSGVYLVQLDSQGRRERQRAVLIR